MTTVIFKFPAILNCQILNGLVASVYAVADCGNLISFVESPDFHISEFALFVGIRALVFEMDADGAISNLPCANDIIYKTLPELAVFAAVLHILIESVDRQNICFPSRCIVSVP